MIIGWLGYAQNLMSKKESGLDMTVLHERISLRGVLDNITESIDVH